MLKDVRLAVVGRIFRSNQRKVLALNECLSEYHCLVKWYLKVNSISKKRLHEFYSEVKSKFKLPTALLQTARDKAVETLKSFKNNAKQSSELKFKRVSIRFDSRCYSFNKTSNILTPYWLDLKLCHERRTSYPVVFGYRDERLVESAFRGEWKFTTVEMVKRNGEWYVHFILKRIILLANNMETVIGIDMGEANLITAVALPSLTKPSKGKFWSGSDIKTTRGLYNHIRRNLGKRKLLKKIKELGFKEKRKVSQQLHILSKQVINYVKQFQKPVVVMEDLIGLRDNMKFSRTINRRVHSMPYRRLQTIIEYKANLEGIDVRHVRAKYTSRTCHNCGYVTRLVKRREFRCPRCGLIYNRDLNAAINIAHALTRGMGWGRGEPPEPAREVRGEKPTPNAGNPSFNRG